MLGASFEEAAQDSMRPSEMGLSALDTAQRAALMVISILSFKGCWMTKILGYAGGALRGRHRVGDWSSCNEPMTQAPRSWSLGGRGREEVSVNWNTYLGGMRERRTLASGQKQLAPVPGGVCCVDGDVDISERLGVPACVWFGRE